MNSITKIEIQSQKITVIKWGKWLNLNQLFVCSYRLFMFLTPRIVKITWILRSIALFFAIVTLLHMILFSQQLKQRVNICWWDIFSFLFTAFWTFDLVNEIFTEFEQKFKIRIAFHFEYFVNLKKKIKCLANWKMSRNLKNNSFYQNDRKMLSIMGQYHIQFTCCWQNFGKWATMKTVPHAIGCQW